MAESGRTLIGPHERRHGATAWGYRALVLLLFLGTLTTFYPLIWLVGNAFKAPEELLETPLQMFPAQLAPTVEPLESNTGQGKATVAVASSDELVADVFYTVDIQSESEFQVVSSNGDLFTTFDRDGDTTVEFDGIRLSLLGELKAGDRFKVENAQWQTENYARAWSGVDFVQHSINTFALMFAIWCMHIMVNALAAYALSRLAFPGSKLVMFLFLMTMMVPWYAIFIPLYLTVTELGLTSFAWGWPAVIIPAGFNAFFLILFKSFFDGLPGALIDAARIDGASEMQTFLHVALPLAKPIFAVITVFSLLATWNDFLWPYLVIANEHAEPLMVRLYNYEKTGAPTEWVLAALAMAMVPPIVLFMLFQRQIAQGFTLSGVKG